jgi:Universal stress protein UspA and related nucleotide-binding proteins
VTSDGGVRPDRGRPVEPPGHNDQLCTTRPALYGVSLVDPTVLDAQRALLTTTVEEWQRKLLEVEISDELVRDTPGHALVTASKSARLVVVGAGEAGRFRGLRLGSVSQQVLHHASSPVAIVRQERHR